jgi:hypothetical protein
VTSALRGSVFAQTGVVHPGRDAILTTPEGGEVIDLDPAPRELGLRLNLGDLNRPPVCHSYPNGCDCESCGERSEGVSPSFRAWVADEADTASMPLLREPTVAAAQPWHPQRRAA